MRFFIFSPVSRIITDFSDGAFSVIFGKIGDKFGVLAGSERFVTIIIRDKIRDKGLRFFQ